MVKVAFLGPKGTYTHQAVLQEFGEDIQILPQLSIGDCFKAVDSNEVDYSVVPFENSTNGQVVFTYDLIRDWYMRKNAPPKFKIVGEQFVFIHHNLLSKELDVHNITKVYSHPQVWGQVTNFLSTLNPNVVRADCSSTSKAAEIVRLSNEKGVACISSAMCSKLYNLPIIKPNIEDNRGNTTRFLILGETGLPKKAAVPKYITSIIFTVNSDQEPGALCSALTAFQENNTNLISINSRPSAEKNWSYAFFVEVIGNYLTDENVQNSLKSLNSKCSEIVTLGVFERTTR
ncbi:Prephenate dehydratase [Yamadazyma tenuis ATCC 10573]|uniref:prephenate dehydratase n=2 Tax=Candida tenuis TaxID=2315449 RepID=G3B269_CANTC|nr:Prephenate dehydratase [Yamadazyma tenuis ATCC 10573]EGV64609.1 Prephenate dehydratase [Yamadazyma tenuis ATCC 10573]